ncbi:MAG: hypothetical protein ACM3MK_09205 [Chitinophagales bacterium]
MDQSMYTIGVVLAVLLLLVSVNSTYQYLKVMKVTLIQWIMFNSCVVGNVFYLIGFGIFILTQDKTCLAIGILPMLFFGTMGLFVFPWQGAIDKIIQFSHIIMTLNIVWSICAMIKSDDYQALALGLLIGLVIFVPFIACQQFYAKTHPEDLHRILGIE